MVQHDSDDARTARAGSGQIIHIEATVDGGTTQSVDSGAASVTRQRGARLGLHQVPRRDRDGASRGAAGSKE